jgi:protein TonB
MNRRAPSRAVASWPLGLAIACSAVGHIGVVLASPRREPAPLPETVELFVIEDAPQPEAAPAEPEPEPEPEPELPRRAMRSVARAVQEPPPETPVETPAAEQALAEPVGAAPVLARSAPVALAPHSGVPVVLASHRASGARETRAGPSSAERETMARAYLIEVRRRIAREKRYPRSARRLGVEGTVRVRFVIARDGSIGSLRASGEASVLREAALEAVRAAGPFEPPPLALGPRVSVDVPVVYVLEEE